MNNVLKMTRNMQNVYNLRLSVSASHLISSWIFAFEDQWFRCVAMFKLQSLCQWHINFDAMLLILVLHFGLCPL
jgi:hypothetical protein